jgi:hypothetical protein
MIMTKDIETKAVAAAPSNTSQTLVQQLDGVYEDRIKWEEGAYRTSNEQLYALLGRCLSIYQQLQGDTAQCKQLTQKLVELGIKHTKGTSLAAKVVRYVFRNDRNRSFAYARTLIAATEAGVDSLALAKWVAENGGVEEVRRAAKGLTPAQLAHQNEELALGVYAVAPSLVEAFDAPAELKPNTGAVHEFCVALVRRNKDGRSSIVYGSANQSLVAKVLAAAGKHHVAKAALKQKDDEERAQKKLRSEIISKAVKENKAA